MSGIDHMLQALQRISPLSAPVATSLMAACARWQVHRGQVLLREHAVSDYIYFVAQGLLRIYYHKDDKEVTEWIAFDDQFCFSITSFFQRVPSHLIIHAIEPGEVYGLPHDVLMHMAEEHHEVERLLRKMVTASLILSQYRMRSIQFETAQQRYEQLVAMRPDYLQRVPLQYIASFLGITKESLSRIRALRS